MEDRAPERRAAEHGRSYDADRRERRERAAARRDAAAQERCRAERELVRDERGVIAFAGIVGGALLYGIVNTLAKVVDLFA